MKQLDSGLLLVSGPFRLNGVPLRRVGQAYVIATSTKVDLAGVSVPETVNDAYFTKSKAGKEGKEDQFFGDNKEKKLLSDDRKSEQKVSRGSGSSSGVLHSTKLCPMVLFPDR